MPGKDGMMTTYGNLSLPPGPSGIGVLRLMHQLYNRVGFFEHHNEKYGDIVYFTIFKRKMCLVFSAEIMEEVFVTHRSAFIKGPLYKNNRILVNPTTMTTVGEEHRRLRKLVQPSFRAQALKQYGEIMVEEAYKMTVDWQDGGQVDVDPLMHQLTLDIVAAAFFGRDAKVESRLLKGVLKALTWSAALEIIPFGRIIGKMPLALNHRSRDAIEELDKVVYEVIAKARSGEERTDLISSLAHTKDELGIDPSLSDAEIRDESYVMLIAGHETSANTLVWCFYYLSCHPEVRKRMESEIDEIIGERRPVSEDYSRLAYTNAVVDEVLRISPPAYAMGRQTIEDCVLGGYHVPSGTVVQPFMRGPHRNEKYWPSAKEFKPERWLEPIPPERPKHAYVPFGGGESKCVGYHFAKMEIVLTLAVVAQNWHVQALSTRFPKLDTLAAFYRIKNGLCCTLHRRKRT